MKKIPKKHVFIVYMSMSFEDENKPQKCTANATLNIYNLF